MNNEPTTSQPEPKTSRNTFFHEAWSCNPLSVKGKEALAVIAPPRAKFIGIFDFILRRDETME